MKVLLSTFFVFILNSLTAQTESKLFYDTTKWENGKIKSINSYLEHEKKDRLSLLNNRQGKFFTFYQTGEIESIRYYKKGNQDSTITVYYKNGNKSEEGVLSPDRNGLWVFWYENGIKKNDGYYKNGTKIGFWQFWDTLGQKTLEVELKDSIYISKKYFYYLNGKTKAIEMYKGPYLVEAYVLNRTHKDGATFIYDLSDNFEHIPTKEWTKYDEDGNIIEKKIYSQ